MRSLCECKETFVYCQNWHFLSSELKTCARSEDPDHLPPRPRLKCLETKCADCDDVIPIEEGLERGNADQEHCDPKNEDSRQESLCQEHSGSDEAGSAIRELIEKILDEEDSDERKSKKRLKLIASRKEQAMERINLLERKRSKAYHKNYRKNRRESQRSDGADLRRSKSIARQASQRDPAELKAYKMDWRKSYREERRAYERKWRESHRDEIRAYDQKRRESHRDEYRAYQKEWRLKRKQRLLQKRDGAEETPAAEVEEISADEAADSVEE